MARMKKKEAERLKQYAETLFINANYTQEEIADKVGVTAKTISSWAEEYKWSARKAAITISKDQELRRLFAQINELNTHIENKEAGKRYADSKEADALKKLTSAVKDLEADLGISETVNVSMKLLQYLRTVDFDLASRLNDHVDRYIKTLMP